MVGVKSYSYLRSLRSILKVDDMAEEKEKKTVEELTEETLRDGGLLVMLYFDMHGPSPEYVQNLLTELLARLANDPLALWTYGEIETPEKFDDVYSSYAEVKVLVRSFNDLVNLVLKYAPISIEVLKPHEITLSIGQLQEVLMDMSQFSAEFTAMYLRKGLDEKKKQEYLENLRKRSEIGKMLIERGKKEKEEKEGE